MQASLSRRSFLTTSAVIGGSLLARPLLGSERVSERINVAFIGCGNQGMGLLNRVLNFNLADVVAVCDANRGSVGFNNKVGPGPGWKPEPVPGGFDYKMWLGPAPEAPYHHDRCLYNFRFNYDYSGGQITNFGAHSCDMAQWGLDRSAGGPTEVVCDSAEFLPAGSLFNTATVTKFRCKYEDGVELECVSSEPKVQARFEGTDGWMQIGYAGMSASRPELLKEAPPYQTPEGELDAHSLHMRNFLRAIARTEELAAPVEVGHASAVLCHVANTAIRRFPERRSETLCWDPVRERFMDNDQANQTLRRPQRDDWKT